MPGKPVFISYSHDSDEHREKVLGLAERLRQDGLDAQIDQYVEGTPTETWPRWMLDRLDEAEFVLVVCTETYYRRFRGHEGPGRGKGADWEGALITQEIYDAKSRTVKFVPVLLSVGQELFIPEPLRGRSSYELTSEEGYQALYTFLRGKAGVKPRPLGDLKPVSKRTAQPLTFGPTTKPNQTKEETPGAHLRQSKHSAHAIPWILAAAALAVALGVLALSSFTRDRAQLPPQSCVPGEQQIVEDVTFLHICPGAFVMGSIQNDPQKDDDDQRPAHPVSVNELWISQTEITNAQFRQYDAQHPGGADLPATDVSWFDASAACKHFGGRLPTEAEWEYAARAGRQTAWSFGDDQNLLDLYAWYARNSGNRKHPVGRLRANDWGLYDVHGNVWEWVADWHSSTYPATAQHNPTGPVTGRHRVLRGGAVNVTPRGLRSSYRNWDVPEKRDWNIGFRCARDAASES